MKNVKEYDNPLLLPQPKICRRTWAAERISHFQSCKEAIERAIRKHFDGMHLDEAAVTEVVQEFGSERVFYILANTVQLKSWDGRFSGKNRQVLSPVPMIDAEETRLTYAVTSHSAVLDGFISQFLKKFKENM